MSLIAAKEKTILDASNVFFIRGSFPLVRSKSVLIFIITIFDRAIKFFSEKAADKFCRTILEIFDKILAFKGANGNLDIPLDLFFAQLLIRKLGSFIRLWRVILLRSDIHLTTSGICYASFMANKISRKP